MASKRSIGVTIFGMLTLLGGIFYFVCISWWLYCFPLRLQDATPEIFKRIGIFAMAYTLAIYLIVCGVGISLLKNWARIMLLISCIPLAFAGVINIVRFLDRSPYLFRANLGLTVLAIVVLWFFTRRPVKEQFKPGMKET